jgi:hypothetical protein
MIIRWKRPAKKIDNAVDAAKKKVSKLLDWKPTAFGLYRFKTKKGRT